MSGVRCHEGPGERRGSRCPGGEWGTRHRASASLGILLFLAVAVADTPGEVPGAGGGCACAGLIRNERIKPKYWRNFKFLVYFRKLFKSLNREGTAGRRQEWRWRNKPPESPVLPGAGSSRTAGLLALTKRRCPGSVPLLRAGGGSGVRGGRAAGVCDKRGVAAFRGAPRPPGLCPLPGHDRVSSGRAGHGGGRFPGRATPGRPPPRPPPRPRLLGPRPWAAPAAGGGASLRHKPGPRRQSGAERSGRCGGCGWSRRVRASPRCSPAGSMKVEFAPINIPLKRRMQTVAVLQWIFSFLLLGNSLPPSCPWPREKRGKNGFLPNQRHPWALVCVTLWFHVGAEVAGWRVASRLSPGGQEHRTSGLGLSLP